jgi:hypothetical protein
MSDNQPGAGARDLFWRRLAAAAADVVLAVIVASLAGVLLYGASDGKLRSSTLFRTTRCQPMRAISVKLLEGVRAPRGARPVAAQLCVNAMLGLETSRHATVVLQSQEGEVTRSLAYSRPVDRKAEPVRPIILDWVYPLGFIAIMSLCEGLAGATPGKRALGLRVVGEGGGRLGLPGALLRNAVIYGGAALVLVAPLLIAMAGALLAPPAYYAAVGVFGLLVLAPVAMLGEAGPGARYDRWAGAEVIRA